MVRNRRRFPGEYQAKCADNTDPQQAKRIKVFCEAVYGPGKYNKSPWAIQKQSGFNVPNEGDLVIISFLNEDPDFPTYLPGPPIGAAQGAPAKGWAPSSVPYEGKLLCPGGYSILFPEDSLCDDCEDRLKRAVPEDGYDNIEHCQWHNHHHPTDPKYYCPRHRLIFNTETGHRLLAIDKDQREFMALIDRGGQALKYWVPILKDFNTGNATPGDGRIMDRMTEPGINKDLNEPAAPPEGPDELKLQQIDLSQSVIADALDGLLDQPVRDALQGTLLGNVLGMMDSAVLNGVPLTPTMVFDAFVANATVQAQQVVTDAMALVGTSPQALLSAIMATPDIVDTLTGTLQGVMSSLIGIGMPLGNVFPSILPVETKDGLDPRIYCEDQWSAVELRDLYRGFLRLEGAAFLGETDTGASQAPLASAGTALAGLGLTQSAVATLMDSLVDPDIMNIIGDTPLGAMLNQITGLTLAGVPLTPGAIFNTFTSGATVLVRNTVTNLLGTAGITPRGLVSAINGFTALPTTLMGVTGSALLGSALSAFGFMGISLFGVFPSFYAFAGDYVGEKAILWRSDRDKTRHQSVIIDHMPGQEKIMISGLNLEGAQVGPQVIVDSGLGGRYTVIDPLTGSFENLECSTGTKEALYTGGRIVGTYLDDILNVGGDWLCFAGFLGPLIPRIPIDPLPVLDMKAYIEPQVPGGTVLGGTGNILHAALLEATRWAGTSIFDTATLNYKRLVGGVDTIDVAGAQSIKIGGARSVKVGLANKTTVGLANLVTVGLTHTVKSLFGNIVHDSAMHIINATTAEHYAAATYELISANVILYGACTPATKAVMATKPVAVVVDAELAAAAGIAPAAGVAAAYIP